MTILNLTPVGKPRMTRSDKWRSPPRKCVAKYYEFKDQLISLCQQASLTTFPGEWDVIFYLPMPKSWSKKKKAIMKDHPHQQKCDIDNLLKALFDALLPDDSYIYDVRARKFWADEGSIHILNF
jgi:Holliday junction resolvase RusA-like endonuclease